ncbi:MAG: lysophospholipid acyltransferase family protein [bacterium]
MKRRTTIPSSSDREPVPPLWRRLRRRVYFGLAASTLAAVRQTPASVGARTCQLLAHVATVCRPRERRRARANLALAFPDLSRQEREQLLRRSVAALGRNLFTTLTVERMAARNFDSVDEDGALAAIAELRTSGRGVLILTGHFGCWELLGAFLAARLGGLGVVTGTIHNPSVDRLVQQQRRQLGMTPLPRDGGASPLLGMLQQGGVVAVLLDQHTRVPNVPVPFFGRPAPTTVGFAKLVLRRRIPVLPVAIATAGDGFRVIHQATVAVNDLEDSDSGCDGLLRRCNESLENFVRRNPAEWVWFHDRWATG